MPQGVEGLDGEAVQPGEIRQQQMKALCHLAGRLPGEGDGQDLLGRHPAPGQKIGQAVGEGPGLAGAGAGGHHQGRALYK